MIEKNKQGAVLWLTIKHPPANALSTKVLKSLDEAITEAENDESVRAIVLHGEGRFFVAGADIKEFQGSSGQALAENGQLLFNKIEQLKKASHRCDPRCRSWWRSRISDGLYDKNRYRRLQIRLTRDEPRFAPCIWRYTTATEACRTA